MSSPVLPNLEIILQLMRRTIKGGYLLVFIFVNPHADIHTCARTHTSTHSITPNHANDDMRLFVVHFLSLRHAYSYMSPRLVSGTESSCFHFLQIAIQFTTHTHTHVRMAKECGGFVSVD